MTEHLEYNSERNHLVIAEYGRHVQKMVEFCMEEEDKSKRTEMAHAIVNVMGIELIQNQGAMIFAGHPHPFFQLFTFD